MDFGEIRDSVMGWLYRRILKPVFFLRDAEKVHDQMTAVGEFLGSHKATKGLTGSFFGFQDKCLEQDIAGMHFVNPVGLAAGFDKDARMTGVLPDVGFGFEEIGSVTAKAFEGNPGQRLYRLPKQWSLRVNYGLKNEGADAIARRLSSRRKDNRMTLGISIAKTNSPTTSEVLAGIEDYLYTYKKLGSMGDYVTINISCPNTCEDSPIFAEPENLKKLLESLFLLPKSRPVFIKLSPDLSDERLRGILDVCSIYPVDGFVCTNLSKQNPTGHNGKGGFSGKLMEASADAMLKKVRGYFGNKKILIGCGGIFTAGDAYKKIRSGASLVQLVTGMIYGGPQTIGEINRGLAKLLRRDGFKNIAEAVGADVK